VKQRCVRLCVSYNTPCNCNDVGGDTPLTLERGGAVTAVRAYTGGVRSCGATLHLLVKRIGHIEQAYGFSPVCRPLSSGQKDQYNGPLLGEPRRAGTSSKHRASPRCASARAALRRLSGRTAMGTSSMRRASHRCGSARAGKRCPWCGTALGISSASKRRASRPCGSVRVAQPCSCR